MESTSSMVSARGAVCGKYISARYVFALMGCAGMGIIYGLKVNLSVAIVSMINHTYVSSIGAEGHDSTGSEECGGTDEGGEELIEDGPFKWSSTETGILLSSYFWGYMVSQIPAGNMAENFSAKWVFFSAVAINVVCTILTPIMAKLSTYALVAMRVSEGIGGGFTFPGMHVLIAHWAPPNERGTISSIAYAGTALGTVAYMYLTGLIASVLGWEESFYIMGGASGLWLILWAILIADTPQKQHFISVSEREMIVSSLDAGSRKKHDKHKVPWKHIFKSKAFWAILVAHITSNWGWYMVLIELPLYMKQVLRFKLSQNAILVALPFFTMWVFSIILGKILDTLRKKDKISPTVMKKVANTIASFFPMICFIFLCFVGCNRTLAVVLMTIGVTCCGGIYCGFLGNHIDIAPNYAGVLVGITNTVATIPGIIVPIFVGKVTEKNPGIEAWRIVFYSAIISFFIEMTFYLIFASGKEQYWNRPENLVPKETAPATAE